MPLTTMSMGGVHALDANLDAPFLRRDLHRRGHSVVHDERQLDRLNVEAHFAGLDARDVENVLGSTTSRYTMRADVTP